MSAAVRCIIVLLIGYLWSHVSESARTNPTFPDNNLLTCYTSLDRQGNRQEESRFRVPLVPQRPGQVWMPQSSVYLNTIPIREPLNVMKLMEFLASAKDFTPIELQFIGTNPNRMPNDGPFLPTQGLNTIENPFPPMREAPTVPFDDYDDPNEVAAVMSFVSARRLGQCNLMASWVRLSDDFFPYWYSATSCQNFNNVSSCSFPEGLTCLPDVSTPNRIAYITVLRWDCCNSLGVDLKSRFECGWRRVDIPVAVDCVCACQPKLR